MKSLENKTGLILDLFFGIVIMPLMIFLGSVSHIWSISPRFAFITVVYLYLVYVLTRLVNVPRIIIKKSYWRLGGMAVGMIFTTWLLTKYPLPEMDFVIPSMSEYQTRVRNHNIAITVWLLFSVTLSYSVSVSFIIELYRRVLLQNIIENQRNKAELALYKAQINPHFMFNTLNSLYSLIVGTSQKAEDAFIKFSELMKYTYLNAENDEVLLLEEVNYISNYIDLQLLRFNGHTKVIWKYEMDDETVKIPPIIFLTFIENTFKYGASSSQDCEVYIELILKKGVLNFKTSNRIMRNSDEFRKDAPIGISNCQSRLSVLFPENFELKVKEEEGWFKVDLTINICSSILI